MHRRRFLQLIGIAPPTLVLATACSGASSGVTVKLNHGPVTRLGEEMMFTMTATTVVDAPAPVDTSQPNASAIMAFSLSPGLSSSDPNWRIEKLADGRANYSRDVVFQAKVPQSIEFHVRLDKPGEHFIQATAGYGTPRSGSTIDMLFLKVSSESTLIQRTPFSQ